MTKPDIAGTIPTLYSSIFGNRQALLVQQNASFEDTGILVNRVLYQRGYDVAAVGPEACTKERVLASIDELVEGSRGDSRTLFYYSGHGFHSEGVTTIVDAHPKGIEPHELFARLGRVRGRKAVFVDACLSGEFVDYVAANAGNIIRNYVVLAATSRDGLSLTARWRTPNIPSDSILNEKTISHLAHWLFMQHAEYASVFLDTWPIDERKYLIRPEDERFVQELSLPCLPRKIKLEIQRTSDVQFDL